MFRNILESKMYEIYVDYKISGSHFYDGYINKVHYVHADNLEKAIMFIKRRISRDSKRAKKHIEFYLNFEEVPF